MRFVHNDALFVHDQRRLFGAELGRLRGEDFIQQRHAVVVLVTPLLAKGRSDRVPKGVLQQHEVALEALGFIFLKFCAVSVPINPP